MIPYAIEAEITREHMLSTQDDRDKARARIKARRE